MTNSPRARAAKALAATAIFVLVLALAWPAQAGTVRIRGRSQRWHPRSVTISSGTRVVWRAVDTTHTVTAYRGSWSKDTRIAAGSTTSFTFRNAGTYKYRCTIHSSIVNGRCDGMCGTVVVT
jgi:plastocyanin